jgi:hypothetical protein
MFDKIKLIERKYLIIAVLLIALSAVVHLVINAPGDRKIRTAKENLAAQEENLKSTKEQVEQAKGAGIGNLEDVVKSVNTYESLVTKDIDELLFDNALSSLAKGSGVTITPPQRSERYLINEKGIGYYNFSFNVTGSYIQQRAFYMSLQGAAGYLVTIGDVTFNFQGAVSNPDGTTTIVSDPFSTTMTTSANVRAWIDLSDRLLAKGTSSREEGLNNPTVAKPTNP